MDVVVECYSGHTYADRPKTFYLDEERFEVESIETEWRSPKGKHFQVISKNRITFELIYDEANDNWRIRKP